MDLASDKKAVDIVLLRTTEVTTMADYFVICTGRSDRQLQALASGIMDELRDDGIRPLGVEGKGAARWVLLDYGAVIVHLFAPESESSTAWSACGATRRRSCGWSDPAPAGTTRVPLAAQRTSY